MVRDWKRVKSTVYSLYVTKGEKLELVRELMINNHHFEASWVARLLLRILVLILLQRIRAYKMKIKEWHWRTHRSAREGTEIVRRRQRRQIPPIVAEEHHFDGDANTPIAAEEHGSHFDGDADADAPPVRAPTSDSRYALCMRFA